MHEKSFQVLLCLAVTLEKQPDRMGEDATEQDYLKFNHTSIKIPRDKYLGESHK